MKYVDFRWMIRPRSFGAPIAYLIVGMPSNGCFDTRNAR